jgi:NADPH:quinone reductase-like Zn-dependent oxidoreductase
VRAAVNVRYGSPDVIEVREVPKPVPGAGDVLVKVHATTVCRTDCGQLRAHPFFMRLITGLARPKRTILGTDFAGEVVAIGEDVASFAPGDRIFGLAPGGYGGHAEYLCLSQGEAFALMPQGLDFHEAVVCEGAWYANSNLQALGVGAGHRVLIYGASGAIGTAAVQLAKYYGAEVTAVVATRHLDLAQALGADHVVDYTRQDFTGIDETFDFVFDAVGKASYFQCQRLLKPQGVFATTDLGPHNQNVLLILWGAISRRRRVVLARPKSGRDLVELLRERLQVGDFRAVIDRRYPLEEIVAAYDYVETGQKTGIVVIDIPPTNLHGLDS